MPNDIPQTIDSDICPHCGAKMIAYWHRLTPILVNTLIKFRAAVNELGRNEIHVPDEIGTLSPSEYNNFQKLRFHALVAKVNEDGERKMGYWLLTSRGAKFLNGKIAVPARVKTFRNQVVDHDFQTLYVKDVIGTTPYVETIADFDRETAPLFNFGYNNKG